MSLNNRNSLKLFICFPQDTGIGSDSSYVPLLTQHPQPFFRKLLTPDCNNNDSGFFCEGKTDVSRITVTIRRPCRLTKEEAMAMIRRPIRPLSERFTQLPRSEWKEKLTEEKGGMTQKMPLQFKCSVKRKKKNVPKVRFSVGRIQKVVHSMFSFKVD